MAKYKRIEIEFDDDTTSEEMNAATSSILRNNPKVKGWTRIR